MNTVSVSQLPSGPTHCLVFGTQDFFSHNRLSEGARGSRQLHSDHLPPSHKEKVEEKEWILPWGADHALAPCLVLRDFDLDQSRGKLPETL